MKTWIPLVILAAAVTAAAQNPAPNRDGTDIGSGGGNLVASQPVSISASRITERVLLVDEVNSQTRVQLLAERTGTATDVSNTHRLILSISQMGEIFGTEANFVVGNAMSLQSAERVGPGVYRIVYNDADHFYDDSQFTVTRTIDARKAVHDVLNGTCEESRICEIGTTVELK